MNRVFSFSGICLIMLLLPLKVIANHIFGGELLYKHISGSLYKVTLTIYGDCGSDNNQTFKALSTSTPAITIYKGSIRQATTILQPETADGIEVSPVCENEAANTACKNPTNPLPGVMQFVYSSTVVIATQSDEWRFVFAGALGGASAGRSTAITNLFLPAGGGVSVMQLEAMLNNTNGPNSSPTYTSIPTPFFCINKPQQYNQGAVDDNNDSLSFSLVPGLDVSNGIVNYLPPYTDQEPLAATPGTFTYNTENGQMGFTPDQAQTSLVVNKVEEYKNGVLVGSSMREMTFIVLSSCNNTPPASVLDTNNITGGSYAGNNTINVCAGTGNVSFKIATRDAENDNVNVTPVLPDGANANIANNDTTNPFIAFDWNTAGLQTGTYNVYFTFKDNGCPLTSSQTTAYTIRIIPPPAVSYTPLNATQCIHREYMQLTTTNGIKPYQVSIWQSGKIVRQYTDTTGIIKDSLSVGHYTVIATSALSNCNVSREFDVVDSGSYPVHPQFKDPHYCKDELPSALVVRVENNSSLNWYTPEGVKMEASPAFNTGEVTTLSWLVSQQYSVCESEKDTLRVYVHENPDVQISNKSKKVCKGDGIYLEATGAEKYRWIPDDKIQRDRDTSYNYAEIMEPVTFRVVGTNRYGCTDTDYVSYEDIEQCCRFYYPNAFTPNMDGKNDGFRVNLYGNAESFELIIFNRWGQKVFQSNDAEKYWDGNFAGNTCDVGVYYYILRAKCVTGHIEESKGEVTLIR